MNRTLMTALAVASLCDRSAVAGDVSRASKAVPCAGRLTADTAVRCALGTSPEVREARERLAALAGRRVAAGVWLPSNPVVSGTLMNRRRPPPEEASVLNWSVALAQEIEIAGQRGARLDVVDAEAAAQVRRVAVAEQEVAAAALAAWYEAVGARESLRFVGDLSETALALTTWAEARAREALLAGVEADVARAEGVRIATLRLESERRLSEARATLAILTGADARLIELPDALASPNGPLPGETELEEEALRLRGEVAAAEAEERVLGQRLALLRRERIPNVTLSAFAERGEINDRIIGVGLSIPLVLPGPLGRTRTGEMAQTRAEIRAAESSTQAVRRRVRLEVARALAAYTARKKAATLFEDTLIARAWKDIGALREGISSRQLSLREALQWQRSLMELLRAEIDARLARALAWVELRRVAGLSLAPPAGESR